MQMQRDDYDIVKMRLSRTLPCVKFDELLCDVRVTGSSRESSSSFKQLPLQTLRNTSGPLEDPLIAYQEYFDTYST